jgi:hypothetical protein
MKRVIFWVILGGIIFISSAKSQAAWWSQPKKDTQEAKPAVPKLPAPAVKTDAEGKKAAQAPKADQAKLEALNAKRELAEKKRKLLNNTEWEIELTDLSGKEKKEPDILTFADNKVSCKNCLKRVLPATNYTLSVQGDATIVWETMQSGEKTVTAFWRGDIDAGMQKMSGVLSLHIGDKDVVDYSFISSGKKNITPEK